MTKRLIYNKVIDRAHLVLGILICQLILDKAISVHGVPESNQPLKRFEYKYSFKPPYLAQKDGTVPFFEYSGSKYLQYVYLNQCIRVKKG